MDRLTEANLLKKEIGELERFIYALDVTGLHREKSNVTAYFEKTVNVKTEWKIFGRRFFGCGAHESNIDVPTSMIPSIVIHAKDLLITQQKQFDGLFGN